MAAASSIYVNLLRLYIRWPPWPFLERRFFDDVEGDEAPGDGIVRQTIVEGDLLAKFSSVLPSSLSWSI